MILTEKKIAIISGVGEQGYVELYGGTLSERAIKSRLTRERSNRDRWARAVQYSHTNEHGRVGVDLETDEYCTFPLVDGADNE